MFDSRKILKNIYIYMKKIITFFFMINFTTENIKRNQT